MKIISKFILYSVLLCFTFSCKSEIIQKEKQPNILFIAVDDLKTELGIYGNSVIQTPNLDKLASVGTAFANHYVQIPTCGASRQSLLTGLRPRTVVQLDNNITAIETSNKPEGETPESFIHHLKRNGYYTVGIGKISHSADGLVYGYNDMPSNKRELPHSWDEILFDSGKWKTGWNSFFAYADGENRQSMKNQVKPYEAGNVEDDGYPDGLTTKMALSSLKRLKEKDKPFFLGVGYFKPHLPFNSPKKYWDLYNRDSIKISKNPNIPKNINLKSLHASGEFNRYALGDEIATLKHRVSDEYAKKLIHGYYACVSYVDEQIGLLIKEVEALGLEENTVIVVWGDHGWHLGDQQVWGKHTIFEEALNSTLVIKVPGLKSSGKTNKTVVETVDIYPTLLELCGIEAPYNLDGRSLVGLMDNSKPRQKDVAYSYFKNGISLRTERYRLTKYFRQGEPTIELYDYLNDPFETINIASENAETVNKLMPLLEAGNTGLYN
ncbi:sulfatase [Flavivirga aquimarina]|uniref:Sulfatase n=1 Tax=Flavivirga aquimarina TaxID=2027862 RepID=A0ABT8WFB8_9FLAO|nr:sulfatase [Flavivirga aquimarina]MDO5971806.1 sulfatase [Flavivirga aquimarina]